MQVISVQSETQFVIYDSGIIKMIDCNTGLSLQLVFNDEQKERFMELQRQYHSGMIMISELINAIHAIDKESII